MIDLRKGDCLELMKDIPDKSIDMILCDLPYGTTACKWDNVILFEPLWEQYNRIIKDNGAIVLFCQQPFTSQLIMSNVKNYKFTWYYKKRIASNFASAKYQPMKHIEEVCVFTKNNEVVNYYPIMQERAESGKNRINAGYKYNSETPNETMGNIKRNVTDQEYDIELKYPENIQEFNNRAKGDRGFHPTQKPVALLEYLIKSHTKENELVLDNCMGSGSTGVACINTNRNFIGIELDEKYFEIAKNRIEEHYGKNIM